MIVLNKALILLRHILIVGRQRQSFLGAQWIVFLIKHYPRRWLAVRLLALSPHYFFRDMQTGGGAAFLHAEFERNQISRERIANELLDPCLSKEFAVLDLGCGAGFLAKAVSGKVARVYACDISEGVLGCAEVLNGSENITYLLSTKEGFQQIEDGSLDLIYSFAVVYHLTDLVLKHLLETCRVKLKPGGTILLHVNLDESAGRTEQEWVSDTSLTGKLKYAYGMNWFYRSKERLCKMTTDAGFSGIEFIPLVDPSRIGLFTDDEYFLKGCV